MKEPEGFCVVPWVQMTAQTNGDLRACCQMIHSPYGLLKDEEQKTFSAANRGIEESRKASSLSELRKKMISGKGPDECRLCYEEEKHGIASKRETYNYYYSNFIPTILEKTNMDGSFNQVDLPLKSLDLRLGNNCNLRCRYCSPIDSNSWADDYVKINASERDLEEEEINLDYNGYKEYGFKKAQSGKWKIDSPAFAWHKDSVFLQQVIDNCHHFDRFYFAGGEPLLIDAHWQLLEECIKKDVAKNISLEYNTNTTLMRTKYIDIWSKFKEVSLGCSIDGINEMAEYLRPPVKWQTISKNLDLVINKEANILVNITMTISVYNLYSILPLMLKLYLRGVDNISAHFVTYPEWCSPQIVPNEGKEKLKEEYQRFKRKSSVLLDNRNHQQLCSILDQIEAHLAEADKSKLIHLFYRLTEKLDSLRGQSFYKTAPKIHELLQINKV